jgi:hypothetical protein
LALIRTILALVILLILIHAGMVYAEVEKNTNQLTNAIYSLAVLLESPARLLLNAVSSSGRVEMNASNIYVVALTAAAGYFILYLLLGVGRRS